MGKPRRKPLPARSDRTSELEDVGPAAPPRIIGGTFRGRKLLYSGDRRTRPMKERVREAAFNLIGPSVKGKHAIDLFAGTGALGLEALSRGAVRATFIEQHFPTADLIRQNTQALGVEAQTAVVPSNTFIWLRREPDLGPTPWLVFCSPPYDFYVERREEMLTLIGRLFEAAPQESVMVVECDERFDPALLPNPSCWDVRQYPPAVVALYWKSATEEGS
jgi:16S rRNA (guanine(966)-N(2))-methyltransferase RsmD